MKWIGSDCVVVGLHTCIDSLVAYAYNYAVTTIAALKYAHQKTHFEMGPRDDAQKMLDGRV